jgi:SP family myo-inositol transporter-like MFS transporter 13
MNEVYHSSPFRKMTDSLQDTDDKIIITDANDIQLPHLDSYLPPELISHDLSGFNILAEGDEQISSFIWLLVCCTSIAPLLYGMQLPFVVSLCPTMLSGFDTGVIAGAVFNINGDLGPDYLSYTQRVCTTTASARAI